MSKLTCKCGHIIDLSPHPNQNEFRLFSESLLEGILEEIISAYGEAASAQDFESRVFGIVFRGTTVPLVINECSSCGRLYVFKKPSDGAAVLTYVPEGL